MIKWNKNTSLIKRRQEKRINRWYKLTANKKIVDFNSTILVITLNVLNTVIQWQNLSNFVQMMQLYDVVVVFTEHALNIKT